MRPRNLALLLAVAVSALTAATTPAAPPTRSGLTTIVQTFDLTFGPYVTVNPFAVSQYAGPGLLADVEIESLVLAFGQTTQRCLRPDDCPAGCFATTLFLDAFVAGAWYSDLEVTSSPPLDYRQAETTSMLAGTFETEQLDPAMFTGTGAINLFLLTDSAYDDVTFGCAGTIATGTVDGIAIIRVIFSIKE